MNVPWFLSPLYPGSEERASLSTDVRAMVDRFREYGYVVLEEPVVDETTVGEVVAQMSGRYTDTQTGYTTPSRKMDAWRECSSVVEVAGAAPVLHALRVLYGREPFPFQTLNFERGTQQRAHSDTIHFHSIPQRFMAGVWVALEDIHPDAGPIMVYPGSHRLPAYDPLDLGLDATWDEHEAYEDAIEAIVRAEGLAGRELTLRRGQAVIWAANLLHGGAPVRDADRTRLSQATHYYFEDCVYYQPAVSDPFVGRLTLKDVVDVRNGRRVPQRYRGRSVEDFLPRAKPGWRRFFGG